MKYVALTLLLAVSALMSCTGSTAAFRNLDRSVEEARELTGNNQPMIDENIAMISAYFEDSDHLLILVGDKETLVDDMSCTSHDQELVAKMFASGIPRFIHLAPKEGLVEGAGNRAYIEAPANIKAAIDYVNQFSSHPGALDHDDSWAFNFVHESKGIFNGACQDLGVHHLGLLEDGKGNLADDVSHMNETGYGERTWNGIPIFGNGKKEGIDCTSCEATCWLTVGEGTSKKAYKCRGHTYGSAKQYYWSDYNQSNSSGYTWCATVVADNYCDD